MDITSISLRLTWWSLLVLCIGIFSSVSFSALGHILLFFPALYFSIGKGKNLFKEFSFSSWSLLLMIIMIILSVVVNLEMIEKPFKNIFKSKYFIIALLAIPAYKALQKQYLTKSHIRTALILFLVATTVATVSGIIGVYTGFNPLKFKNSCHPTRACGLYGMYMTYGYGISMFMVILTGLVIYRDRLKEIISSRLLIIFWVINFAGLILAFARGGWIGFFLAIPLFFFKSHKKIFLSISLGVAILAAVTMSFDNPVRDAFVKRGDSNSQRISFFKSAYYAFQEKPLLGWGYRNFEPNVKKIKNKYKLKFHTFGGHAHNNYLEHLASTGILGLIALLLFNISWLIEMYKRNDLLGSLFFPFVMSFTISGQFQYTFGDGENLFLIMTIYVISQIPIKKDMVIANG